MCVCVRERERVVKHIFVGWEGGGGEEYVPVRIFYGGIVVFYEDILDILNSDSRLADASFSHHDEFAVLCAIQRLDRLENRLYTRRRRTITAYVILRRQQVKYIHTFSLCECASE